jgi:hypothetical protein
MNMDLLFLSMVFLHIIDDFVLQRISKVGELKQKKWWKNNASNKMYEHDYIVALFVHSFSWAFMIMLPILIYVDFNITSLFTVIFICNMLIHGFVDHLKANLYKINLIQDQLIHITQIFITMLILGLQYNIII